MSRDEVSTKATQLKNEQLDFAHRESWLLATVYITHALWLDFCNGFKSGSTSPYNPFQSHRLVLSRVIFLKINLIIFHFAKTCYDGSALLSGQNDILTLSGLGQFNSILLHSSPANMPYNPLFYLLIWLFICPLFTFPFTLFSACLLVTYLGSNTDSSLNISSCFPPFSQNIMNTVSPFIMVGCAYMSV